MSWGQAATQAPANPNGDFLVANPPNDGISSLSWSPTGNFLVATAWDGDVRERARRPRTRTSERANERTSERRGLTRRRGASRRDVGVLL